MYHNDTTEYHYLYDGGTLIAVFDENDGVDKMYINGADGAPVAVYQGNVSTMRYYFIKDQIGNTRVMVGDTGRVVYYANYYPFGNIQTSYVAYNEPLKFTGKERDKYRDFEYDYFGARYYDPDIGMFSTVDKAAQLASGFNYCGNNPVMMVDPDGQWFWLVASIAMGAWSGFQIGDAQGHTGMNLFGDILAGAGLGAFSSVLGSAVGASSGRFLGALAGSGFNQIGTGIMANQGFLNANQTGMWIGSGVISAGTGAIIGASITGPAGAFAEGAISAAGGTLLNKGNIGEALTSAALGGGLGLAGYSIERTRRYSRTTGDNIFDSHRKDYSWAIETTLKEGGEAGVLVAKDGRVIRIPPQGTKGGIDFPNPLPEGTVAAVHGHETPGGTAPQDGIYVPGISRPDPGNPNRPSDVNSMTFAFCREKGYPFIAIDKHNIYNSLVSTDKPWLNTSRYLMDYYYNIGYMAITAPWAREWWSRRRF